MFKKDLLSFDIGTFSTKVVLGQGKKNRVILKDAFSFPTPKGAIEDGDIVNHELLKEMIIRKLDEKGIYTDKALFTVASTKAITRELTLPYIDEKKMEAMIPFELPKHLPIAVDNYVIKHITLDVFKEGSARKANVLVIALPKHLVRRYWNLCAELEMDPEILTLHGVGAGRFFSQGPIADETLALIDLGHVCLNCNIISGGKLLFNRIVSTAGLRVTPDQFANYDKDISPVSYAKNVEATINKWLEEIKLVFRFYYSLQNKKQIDRIILLGGAAGISNMAEYFQEKLEIPTSVLLENEKVIYKGYHEDFTLNKYFNAVSALSLN